MMKLIAEKLLSFKVKKVKRRRGVSNLKVAKTALLVYNATNLEREKKIRDYAHFLKEEGVKTDTIGFYKLKGKEDKKPADELGYFYFDKNDTNFFDLPKDSRILKLIENEYNILIDINFKEDFCLEAITSLSRSNFKVGLAESYKNEICDLTIALKEKKIDNYLSQVTTYLKMINKK